LEDGTSAKNMAKARASGRWLYGGSNCENIKPDERPVALLATNVLGDSLTLGRNAFASSMAEWIEKTVQYFAKRNDVQLVVRVHPGERLMKGPSMLGVIERAVPQRPAHIRVVGPDEKINTYDCGNCRAGASLHYYSWHGMAMRRRSSWPGTRIIAGAALP
jgi:hypothetical protein